MKTVSDKVVSIHYPTYPCKNDWLGRPVVPEILDQTDHVGAKSPIFDLFARDSAVTPNEKVKLTLIGSPLRAFQ